MIDQHDPELDFDFDQLLGRNGGPAGTTPPLESVMSRGRRLRFQARLARAGGAFLAGALVLGAVNALPAPERKVRVASDTGDGGAPAPDFGHGGEDAGEAPDEASKPPSGSAEGDAVPKGGHGQATTPTTAKPHTTPTTVPAPAGEGGTDPGTPKDDKPELPHSTVPTTNGALASLSAAGLTPAFSPDVTAYQATATDDIMTVTATLADPDANLYIQSTHVTSGQPFKAWVGDGKHVDIVIYSDWTEIGRYTITLPGQPTPLPPPAHSTVETTNGKLSAMSATGLSPAFDADVADYTAPADGDIITVTVTLADPDANLFIQSTRVRSGQPFKAWVGDGKDVDIVIYSDWTEIGRYTIDRSN